MAKWMGLNTIGPQTYVCGYCGKHVSSNAGFHTGGGNSLNHPIIAICPGCEKPTFFRLERKGNNVQDVFQTPQPRFGNNVESVPTPIDKLYEEARQCTGAEAYTACVLVCRKLLMHIAVQQGAKPGDNFISYVQYLADNGYVPPNGKIWVDHIRKKGNEANHDIVMMTPDESKELLSFIEMLLKFIYEFPARFMLT